MRAPAGDQFRRTAATAGVQQAPGTLSSTKGQETSTPRVLKRTQGCLRRKLSPPATRPPPTTGRPGSFPAPDAPEFCPQGQPDGLGRRLVGNFHHWTVPTVSTGTPYPPPMGVGIFLPSEPRSALHEETWTFRYCRPPSPRKSPPVRSSNDPLPSSRNWSKTPSTWAPRKSRCPSNRAARDPSESRTTAPASPATRWRPPSRDTPPRNSAPPPNCATSPPSASEAKPYLRSPPSRC